MRRLGEGSGSGRRARLAWPGRQPCSPPPSRAAHPSIPPWFHLNLRFANRVSARAPVRRGLHHPEYQENEDEPNRVHIAPDHAQRLALLLRHLHLIILLLAGLAPVTSGAAHRGLGLALSRGCTSRHSPYFLLSSFTRALLRFQTSLSRGDVPGLSDTRDSRFARVSRGSVQLIVPRRPSRRDGASDSGELRLWETLRVESTVYFLGWQSYGCGELADWQNGKM